MRRLPTLPQASGLPMYRGEQKKGVKVDCHSYLPYSSHSSTSKNCATELAGPSSITNSSIIKRRTTLKLVSRYSRPIRRRWLPASAENACSARYQLLKLEHAEGGRNSLEKIQPNPGALG